MQQAGPISKHNLKLINFAAAEGSLGIMTSANKQKDRVQKREEAAQDQVV
jgi:hypothetical protein